MDPNTPPVPQPHPDPNTPDPNPPTDAGSAEVAKNVEEENRQGFRGQKVDPTPNEHYTVDGVTSGKPTPETDADAKAKAQQQNR